MGGVGWGACAAGVVRSGWGGPPLSLRDISPPAGGEMGSGLCRAFLAGGWSGRFSAVGVGRWVRAWVDRLDSCLRRNDGGGRG